MANTRQESAYLQKLLEIALDEFFKPYKCEIIGFDYDVRRDLYGAPNELRIMFNYIDKKEAK